MNNNIILPKEEGKFVDRQQEVSRMKTLLSQLTKKQPLQKYIHEFNGIGGIGKTVILDIIAKTCYSMKLSFAKYDFSHKADKDAQLIPKSIGKIIDQFVIKTKHREKLENILSKPDRNVQDLEKLFVDYIKEIVKEKNKPLVFIFDTLDEAGDTIRDWLGSLISQTLDLGSIVFVLASKSALNLPVDERVQTRWQTYRLIQFNTDETKTQIETFETALSAKEIETLSRDIFGITRGHPLGNNIVWKEFKEQKIPPQRFKENIQLYIQKILEDVIDKWVLIGFKPEEQEKLKSILRPLSIARLFNLISLQKLIEEFVEEKKYHLSSSFYYSNYIRELQSKTNFIRYEPAKSGYAVGPTLANAFTLFMKQNDSALFTKINQRLIEIYSEWIKKSTGTDKIKYIKEKYYHKLKIDTPINEIINEFKRDLNEFKGKENEHLRLQFREELENDYDLCDILEDNIKILTDYIKGLK